MMTIVNVLPTFLVADFDAAVTWYQTLFGRAPDRRPMDGLVEWQLTEGGGVQVSRVGEGAGCANVTIGVDDVDTQLATLAGTGISAEAFDTPSGRFRLATIRDPAGNTITLAQGLGGTDVT
jgi:predicted enzyme related to lactoylglutathione lyase